MATEYNVLAPGPVNLHPKVREALAQPMIHHRTPEFDAILRQTLSKLKTVFSTKENVFILTSTGSGGMEALLVNCLEKGDEVLGIDSGKFGERWCDMVDVFGGVLHRLKVPWGEIATPDQIRAELKKHPKTKIILTQACETSTGVLHPIKDIGLMLKKEFPDVLFLVDGITALGACPMEMDHWNIDGLVGGSQKAFMLPTGLSLISFSQKAWKKIETNPQPRYYFDIRREKKANDKGETFFSSNVSLIRALDVVLDLVFEKGLPELYQEIEGRAQLIRKEAKSMGLEMYTSHPSPTLTALKVPEHIDSQKMREYLEKNFHITIMGGQDQLKGKILRIGHMGYIQDHQQKELIEALKKTLAHFEAAR